jgi:hypothetical protein
VKLRASGKTIRPEEVLNGAVKIRGSGESHLLKTVDDLIRGRLPIVAVSDGGCNGVWMVDIGGAGVK